MTNTNLDIDYNHVEFVDYCQNFYDMDRTNSIYPFATEAEIRVAVLAHITDLNPAFPFDGDTADREAVRDRILAIRKITKFGPTDWIDAVNAEYIKRGETGLIVRI